MRSTHVTGIPNMKGKPSYSFGCGCCEAQDFRGRERDKLDRQAMFEAMRGVTATAPEPYEPIDGNYSKPDVIDVPQ